MNTQLIIEKLKEEVGINPATKAVIEEFARRQRARSKLALKVLHRRMQAKGHPYTAEQYAHVLQLLSRLNLGKLEYDAKKRVKALKDINVTFQSLGKAVLEGNADLKGVKRQKTKFVHITKASTDATPVATTPTPQQPKGGFVERRKQPDMTGLIVTVAINGKPINIEVPNTLTTEEIASLMSRFQRRAPTP